MRELIGIMHSTITPIHSDLKKYKDETERLVAESHAASAAIRVSRKQGLNSIKKRWENAVDDEFKKFRRNLQGHILGSKLGVAVPLLGGFCNKFDIEILSANAGQGSFLTKQRSQAHAVINKDDNTNSVVLKVTHKKGRQSAILTGDARGVTTDQIILYNDGPGVPLRTDVMLACHHGADSHESNNKEWIEVTNPKSTILSCGHRADYLHPMCNVVEAYVSKAAIHGTEVTSHKITCGESSVFTEKNITSPVYSTHDSGTITAIFRDTGIDINVGSETFNISKSVETPLRDPEALDTLVKSLSLTTHAPNPKKPYLELLLD